MKKHNLKMKYIYLTAFIILVAAAGCKNPLVSVIEEEVEVAVTPPEVVSVFPENREDDVPITLNTIIVTLSKNIDSSSVNSSTFAVSAPGGAAISGSRSVEDATVTFTPNSSLSVGTVYTVVIDGIKDTDGNPVSETFSWTFTTGIEGDSVRPTVNSVTINDGDLWTNNRAVNVAVDATDNFGVAQMNVSTTGSFSDAGWIPFESSFTVNLPETDGSKTIYIKLKDGSGLVTENYSTASIGLDTVSPEIALFALDGGNTGTRNSLISIDILGTDEDGGSGISEYRLKTEGTDWGEWGALSEGSINLSDQPLTAGADESETFYLQVRDSASNISDSAARSIIYDFTAPEVDGNLSNPVPGSSGNRTKSYVKIVFNEEMDTGTISSSTVYVSKGIEQISTAEYSLSEDKTSIEFYEFMLGGETYIMEQNTSYNIFIAGTVSDVAGNTIGSDYTYTFSNSAFLDDTAPEGEIVLNLDSPDINATAADIFDLQIRADDDYNGVRAVKIWGDNLGAGFATFEGDASWMLYSETETTDGPDGLAFDDPGDTGDGIEYMSYDTAYAPAAGGWQVPANDNDYYIYYRFIDYANNESETPGVLRISYDGTPPSLNGLQIDDGSGYSNNPGDTVNVILDAVDEQSGLKSMWLSVDASSALSMPASKAWDDPAWVDWAPATTNFLLPSGEGRYFIYGEAQDWVSNVSTLQNGGTDIYASVVLDYTDPVIVFTSDDIIETNSIKQQSVVISDTHPAGGGAAPYQIPSGLASFYWEKVSGPGTLLFYSDEGSTLDNTVEFPYIKASASDGTEDGSYEIKVTATDYAGNTSYEQVDFIWDTVKPGDIGLLTAYNSDGSVLNTSDNPTYVYTSSARPYISWTAPSDADFYAAITWDTGIDPNNPHAWPRGNGSWYPFWEEESIDWTDSSTYEDYNYMKSTNPVIYAPPVTGAGSNDGRVYFYVSAWDDAGNRSNHVTHALVQFWIDTLPPVVTKLKDLPPVNGEFIINYELANDLGDGRVFDQRTAFDNTSPPNITDGSGIASYLWEEVVEEGESPRLTITNADTLDPTISAALDGSDDGIYELKLTVTDNAGNTGEGSTSFEWDTIKPAVPSVTGIAHTPNVKPTWSWNTSGGGNGDYRYRLTRRGRDWEENGGAYLGSETEVFGWTETPALLFEPTDTNYPGYPTSELDDKYEYKLYVEEQDEAGNWSDSGTAAIWIDTKFTSEPALNLDGASLRNGYGTNRQVTWNWSTGLGAPSSEQYRYRLLNSSSSEVIGWTDLAVGVKTKMIDFATANTGGTALPDGQYTFEVEEWNLSKGELVGKVAASNVVIDATAPSAPVMYTYSSGYSVENNGYHLTNDTTPYLRWSSGGGGIGSYQWSFDETNWSQTTSIYVIPYKPQGTYTFYVQERDSAGNWSDSAVWKFEIDTTKPVLSSILLKNQHLNAVNDEIYTVSNVVDIEVTGSGSNTTTYPDGDIRYMRFWNSGSTDKSSTYVGATGEVTTRSNWNLYYGTGTSTADGEKTVFCELVDWAGNTSVVVADDSIILDTAEPVISSFRLDNGAVSTSDITVSMDTVYSGATHMRISTDGGSTWDGWYPVTSSKDWDLSSGNGAKKIIVQFTDTAGLTCRNLSSQQAAHYTEEDDSIFYGSPVINYAHKGYYKTGTIGVYYDSFPSETGSSNTFEIWYSTTPTGTKTKKGQTTNTGYYSTSYTEGTLYYFFVRVSNPDVLDTSGNPGYTGYSSYKIGYSSDMAIVYDDDDSDDTSLASVVRDRITRQWVPNYPDSYSYGLQGGSSMPGFSVTLVPEDVISNSFSNENKIYGDPVVITPGTSWDYFNKLLARTIVYTGKIRNIVDTNKGVLAMHETGSEFIGYAVDNWTTWGLGDARTTYPYDTRPTGLDYPYDRGYTRYAGTTTYSSAYDYIWYRYIKSTSLYDNYRSDPDKEEVLFQTSTTETPYGSPNGGAEMMPIYSSKTSGASPDYIYFYADAPNYPNYYTAARQGRFTYYAYNKVPAYLNGGIPFFYNLIRFLNYYY